MKNVRLHFEIAQSALTLKVHLRAPKDEHDFRVDVERLEEAAKDVRDTLTKICLDYVHKPPGERSCNSASPKLLQDLAMQGDVMRSLFLSGQQEIADLLRNDYANSPITFDLDKRVKCHVPWGLMFDVPERPGTTGKKVPFEELTDTQLRGGFWCTNHRLSVVYAESDGPSSREAAPADRVEETKLLAVFHTDAWKYADPERRVRWVNGFSSLIEFLKYLREHQNEEWILYFFCHAEENTLFIRSTDSSSEDKLIPEGLMNYLDGDSQTRKRGIVFLNGCKTGVSKRKYSWQLATRHRGLAGYIGTEAIVPTRFAWRFGNDLLYSLASGMTPEDAMHELRERHWPLSLLYGAYCVPDSAATSAPFQTSLSKPSDINYCSLPLSDEGDKYATLPFLEQRSSRRRHLK